MGDSQREHQERILKYGCPIVGCLIRRDLFFKNNLFYPEKVFFEDNAVGDSLIFSANEIKVIDKELYHFYLTIGSSSRTLSLERLIDRVKTTDLYYNNMSRLGFITTDNKSLVDYCYIRLSLTTISGLVSLNEKSADSLCVNVINKIKIKLPNPYVTIGRDLGIMISHPYFYLLFWRKIIQFLSSNTPLGLKTLFHRLMSNESIN